jgi:hypothetical protein
MMGEYVLQQLGYGIPLLIVYLVCIVLAAIFVRKHPLASMLALAGAVILLVNVIAIAVIQGYFFQARITNGWTAVEYANITRVIGLIGAVVRALGSALLVAAIFVGRKAKAAI